MNRLRLIILTILLFSCGLTAEDTSILNDGPYIFLDKKEVVTICDSKVNRIGLTDVNNITVEGLCNDSLFSLQANPDEYFALSQIIDTAENIFVFSDIHGEYEALCSLLVSNKILTPELKWNFGTGHLVALGDIFDRGDKVTEILWMLFRLEQEANKAGGRVHYLMGNHELMVTQGDLRYIAPKYQTVCSLLNIPYDQLYSRFTLIGQWMESKNVIEKINDILFVHAGISPQLIDTGFTIKEINSIMREYMFDSKLDVREKEVSRFLYGSFGPVWYRGFITETKRYERATEEEIDRILDYFDVSRIIVGHCVLDSVDTFYNGKVVGVNIDYPEFEAHQGLFIEKGQLSVGDVHGNRRKITSQ